MPAEEAPKPNYPNLVTFIQEMTDDPKRIDGELQPYRRRLQEQNFRKPSDDIAMATLFMHTGAAYLKGLTEEALHKGNIVTFYPGGIGMEKNAIFDALTENEKRTIMLNYAALVYGLSLQIVSEMMQRKQGLFFVDEFCARYNLLINGTAFPSLKPEHFQSAHFKPHTRMQNTDDGLAEIIPEKNMVHLENAYAGSGILMLFDQNNIFTQLPKHLLWFIRNQHLADYFPLIHQEVRKHMIMLENGRRNYHQQMIDDLTVTINLELLAKQMEGISLDPDEPPSPSMQLERE